MIFDLRQKLAVVEWSHAIHEAIKSCAKEHGTAAQGRHAATGDGDGYETQTPSINAVLELLGRRNPQAHGSTA